MSGPQISARYRVESSDVLQDMRINVSPVSITPNQTLGIKYALLRHLTEMEIIDDLLEHTTSRVLWTVHRPRRWERGWYIRIRHPRWPIGEYVAFAPERAAEGALGFTVRTQPSRTFTDVDSSHSYPPTPRSPSSTPTLLSPIITGKQLPALTASHNTQLAPFLLAPSLAPVPVPPSTSLLTRAFSVIQTISSHVYPNAPTNSNSFTLTTPLARSNIVSPGSPAASFTTLPNLSTLDSLGSPTVVPLTSQPAVHQPILTPALLAYTDTTPVWSISSTSGFIDIDMTQAAQFAVARKELPIPRFVVEDVDDTDVASSSREIPPGQRGTRDEEDLASFWITIALTYLAFLGERQSYLAALTD